MTHLAASNACVFLFSHISPKNWAHSSLSMSLHIIKTFSCNTLWLFWCSVKVLNSLHHWIHLGFSSKPSQLLLLEPKILEAPS